MSTRGSPATEAIAARRTALITGASSGFGSLFAERFAADGFDVVLVARSVEPMEQLADRIRSRTAVQATIVGHDLAAPGASATLMGSLASVGCTWMRSSTTRASTYGPFAETSEDTMAKMLMVNVVAMTELARARLPGMLERRWGRMILLGSVASFSAAPMTAAYAATKAYVLSLGLALHDELKGSGVTVTTLCPGPTATGFQMRADMHDSALIRSGLDSAEGVVDKGYAAMKAGRPYHRHRNDQSVVRVRHPVPAQDGGHEDRGQRPTTRRLTHGEDLMLKEFREFAMKGNLIDVAVGLVLALAFTGVVTALIGGIIMPLIAAIVANPASTPSCGRSARAGMPTQILIGSFISSVVNFLLIAWVLFLIVRAANRFRKPAEDEEAGPTEVELLTQIRDSLARLST